MDKDRLDRWYPLILTALMAYQPTVQIVQATPAQTTAAVLLVVIAVALSLPGKK